MSWFILKTLLGILWTYFTATTSGYGCTIVRVGKMMTCCCCFWYQHQFLFYWIQIRYFALTTSSPDEPIFTSQYSVILQSVCLWYKLNSILSHCRFLCCIYGNIINRFNQRGHIVTDVTKDNLNNLMKRLTCCWFLWQCYYTPVVNGGEHWSVSAICNRLAARLLLWRKTTNPRFV